MNAETVPLVSAEEAVDRARREGCIVGLANQITRVV